MSRLSNFTIPFKALAQLGPEPVLLNGLYRLGLATGHYQRVEKNREKWTGGELQPIFPLPVSQAVRQVIGESGLRDLLAEADEITAGKARLFGGEPVAIRLSLTGKLEHWTAYETGRVSIPFMDGDHGDIKFLWEPARFGWAFSLGRAFHQTGDEKYAQAFWKAFELFDSSNPPYYGPHWMSGQEVALRLMAWTWAGQVFGSARSSTPERRQQLAAAVASHAQRIPPTLVYARSQQNNHLLSEAAGLLTAGLALPGHPESARWISLGWKWLNRGLQAQIDGYGEYSQHSTNYHRLMLQLALWVHAMLPAAGLSWQLVSMDAIKRSVHWLLSLLDAESGQVPNLGANDGAYIFPLTVLPFNDHRPVLHAAARAFINYQLPAGTWDELALWHGLEASVPGEMRLPRYVGDQVYGKASWASLRTAQFTNRPSHADQLHLDLWWNGLNISPDAGTYLYNAPAPWDNSLARASVHNTVTVDGRDPFTRAGRFLYLDWADAYRQEFSPADPACLHLVRGRLKTGRYRHTRLVSVFADDRWRVEDEVLPLGKLGRRKPFTARLHWLLPDWEWKLVQGKQEIVPGTWLPEIHVLSPQGWIVLRLEAGSGSKAISAGFSIARGGEVVQGECKTDPTRGWISPTYGKKQPALSLALEVKSQAAIQFTTEVIFPA